MNSKRGRKFSQWTIEPHESDECNSFAETKSEKTEEAIEIARKRRPTTFNESSTAGKRRRVSRERDPVDPLSRVIRHEDKQSKRRVKSWTEKLRQCENKIRDLEKKAASQAKRIESHQEEVVIVNQRVEQLEREKECKELMCRLKGFHCFSNLAAKLKTSQKSRLQFGETMLLKSLTTKKTKKTSLVGVKIQT